MNFNKYTRLNIRYICLVLSVVCLVGSAAVFGVAKFIVEPNLEAVVKLRAESLVSRAVNEVLAEQFGKREKDYDLFIVGRNDSGNMEMVQADSLKINVLMAEISMGLQKYFRKMKEEDYKIPAGALFGSKVFSQVGPSVKIKIVPMSVATMDFKTEFESQGINQTKYKIYIELECSIKVLAPFSSEIFNTSTTVLVAEAVIMGDVPGSYVEVPEEDILDVIEE